MLNPTPSRCSVAGPTTHGSWSLTVRPPALRRPQRRADRHRWRRARRPASRGWLRVYPGTGAHQVFGPTSAIRRSGRTDSNGNWSCLVCWCTTGTYYPLPRADIPADCEVQKNERCCIAPPYRGGASRRSSPRCGRGACLVASRRGRRTSVVVPANGMLQVATGAGWLRAVSCSDRAWTIRKDWRRRRLSRAREQGDTCDFTLHC